MRYKFVIISLMIMICWCNANVYANEQMNIEVDKATCKINVSGVLGTEFANRRVVLYCVSENDDSVLSSDANTQYRTELFKIFRQSITNQNGEYAFNDLKINSASGDNCIFYLTIESSSERVVSGPQYIPSVNEINTFLQNISSKNEDLIYSTLEKEISLQNLGVRLPLYTMLNDTGKKNVVSQVKENTYDQITDVETFINECSIEECFVNIREAHDIDKILFTDDYPDLKMLASVIKEKNGFEVYKSNNDLIVKAFEKLSSSEKNKIYKGIVSLMPKSIDDFYDKLSINVISYEFDNVAGYGDVYEILKNYSSTTLKDMNYSEYLSCKYKNEINRDLLNENFKSIKELCDYINTAITNYNKKEHSDNSSGSSKTGGGGGSKDRYSGSVGFGVNVSQTVKSPETVIDDPVFSDIAGFVWAKESIENLYHKGIVSGTGNGYFQPSREVTREEFIKMLLLIMEYKVEEGDCNFDDVRPDAWFSAYVYSANKNGLVNGISEKQFGVGLPITREDVAVLIWRACQGKEVESEQFSDGADVSDYAKNAVMWLKENEIVSGYNDGTFRPKNLITRAETAKILWTLFEIKQQL